MDSVTIYQRLSIVEMILRLVKRILGFLGGKSKPGKVKGADKGNESDSESVKESDSNKEKPKVQPPPPPPPPPSFLSLQDEYQEERRATSEGPQLFTLLVDHSASMEESNKAREATEVVQKIIQYANSINTADQTGTKTYFYTQVILFADEFKDSTGGMKRPPNSSKLDKNFKVRSSEIKEENAWLGNLTNYQKPLSHVYKTLKGKQGMSEKRLKAGMPAPIVLFITDGLPNLPKKDAVKLAIEEADKIKSLRLPQVTCYHPTYEEITYPAEQVSLITIGLGNEQEFDPKLLGELCTHVKYKGEDLPFYLHCPKAESLCQIGTQIVGTVTRADQSGKAGKTLADVIYELRKSLGMQ